MIEITEVEGRYEILSPDRHWEAFDCKLSAHAAALALAAEVEQETGTLPRIAAPWALYPPVRTPQSIMRTCPSHLASTGNRTIA